MYQTKSMRYNDVNNHPINFEELIYILKIKISRIEKTQCFTGTYFRE